MHTKIGISLELPEGKQSASYAEIAKALTGKVELFDRDKELLIVDSETQQQFVLAVMQDLNIEASVMKLRLLAPDAELTDLFDDYGFTSQAEHDYLYDKIVTAFRFAEGCDQADVDQASLQIEEHLIARYSDHGRDVYIVDAQLAELMHGIAKAYRCRIELLP